jgi:hypothetical protein
MEFVTLSSLPADILKRIPVSGAFLLLELKRVRSLGCLGGIVNFDHAM